MKNVLAVVLAGGKGSRLEPLTRDRAKPAVPFGGAYRIIDFTLSNCLNSGLRKMLVLTQYKAMSLDRHINLGWRHFLCRELGEFIDVVPPQQRIDEHWYQGTADAVYQNIYTIEKERPEYVVILAGDHIYKMNYGTMVEFHQQNKADLTIGALRVPVNEAREFGVMRDRRRTSGSSASRKSRRTPRRFPAIRSTALASMGIYVFTARFLFEQLCLDATRPGSKHDFGHNIIPVDHRHAPRLRLSRSATRTASKTPTGATSARSTPTYEANMDLISVDPLLNMYDDALADPHVSAELCRRRSSSSPTKGATRAAARRSTASSARARSSPAARSSARSWASTRASTASRTSKTRSCSTASTSAATPKSAGRSSTRECTFPPGTEIGFDHEHDRARGFTVSEGGVTVIAKADGVEHFAEAGDF